MSYHVTSGLVSGGLRELQCISGDQRKAIGLVTTALLIGRTPSCSRMTSIE
jgi:hypothetical protein